MRESQIQANIIKSLKKDYPNAYIIKVTSATKRGVPDIIACINGRFIGIEVKTPKTIKNVSKLQEKNILDITKAGGFSFVVSGYNGVKNWLKRV